MVHSVHSISAITALSPVRRARVIIPADRSPKASPVLRGVPQTIVRRAPEASKPEAKEAKLEVTEAKEATKVAEAPKESLPYTKATDLKAEAKEAKEGKEAKEAKDDSKKSRLEDEMEAAAGATGEHSDSPDLLGDFRTQLSQTSTQASEAKCESPICSREEEVRSVRPLPPRPQHAPDLREVCLGRTLDILDSLDGAGG